MKDKILAALKAKFEGVGDAILERIANKAAKTVTDEAAIQGVVDAYTIQQVIDGYADSRATEAAQTAVKNYEGRYKLKEGQPLEAKEEPQTGNDNAVPEWAKALIDANKKLSERLNEMDGMRITETRKQQLATITEKLPDTLRKPYARVELTSLTDDEFATLKQQVSAEVDAISSDLTAKGAVFGLPTAHTHAGGEALTKEQEEAVTHRTGVVSDNKQPF